MDKSKEGFCFDHARKSKAKRQAAARANARGTAATASSSGGVSAATAPCPGTAAPSSVADEADPAVSILSRLSDQYLGEALIPSRDKSSFSSHPKSSSSSSSELVLAPPIPKSWSGAESRAVKALEMESETDSEGELALNDAAWKGDAESDAESVDSEQVGGRWGYFM